MKATLVLVIVVLLTVSCDNGEAETPSERVLEPIDSVDIRIAESFPPQYFLDVVSGLPSGCATFDTYEVERAADTITITIWNSTTHPRTAPAPPSTAPSIMQLRSAATSRPGRPTPSM